MDRLPADRVIAIALDNSSASRKDILPNVMQMVTSSTFSVCSWLGKEVSSERQLRGLHMNNNLAPCT